MAHPVPDREQRPTEEDRIIMKGRLKSITPKFVEYIPADGKELVPGIVYISMKHKTVVHRCPCGCGELSEFMLDPIRFRIEYDGRSVTFDPSIGNSNLQCRSHYWIRQNQIRWCAPMQDWETAQAQKWEFTRALEERKTDKINTKPSMGNLWTSFMKWRKR